MDPSCNIEPQAKDKNDSAVEPDSLFLRLGKIEGIQALVKETFNLISESNLSKYYSKSKMEVVQKKYTYFISNKIGGQVFWMGPKFEDIHNNLSVTKEGKQCPVTIKAAHYDQWFSMLEQAMVKR